MYQNCLPDWRGNKHQCNGNIGIEKNFRRASRQKNEKGSAIFIVRVLVECLLFSGYLLNAKYEKDLN